MLTKEAVLSALKELGNTARQAAVKLKALGIKGICGCPQKCVVANYLSSKFPGNVVDVTGSDATVGDIRVTLPKPIVDLVAFFDMYYFPDLDSQCHEQRRTAEDA